MNVFVKLLLACLLVLVTQHIFKIVYLMDYHVHLHNHYPGVCHRVEGIDFGSEDMLLTPDGKVFITSGFQKASMSPAFKQFTKDKNIKGRVFLFNFMNPAKTAIPLKMQSTETFDVDKFHPHGISGFVDASGAAILFVVNHGYDHDRVEKFQYVPEKQELKHLQFYSLPAKILVNDVEVTGQDSFYFSVTQLTTSALANTMQAMLGLPWTYVGFCQGSQCDVVASGFIAANGVAQSPDKKFLYVADSFSKDLRVFSCQPNNSLVLMQIYPLYTLPDNLFVDERTGDVYVGCHPITHQASAHLTDPGTNPKSTSQVLKLKTKGGMVVSSEELFLDDGSMISASSIAVVYKQRMLIGSVIDKMVYCDVTVPL